MYTCMITGSKAEKSHAKKVLSFMRRYTINYLVCPKRLEAKTLVLMIK